VIAHIAGAPVEEIVPVLAGSAGAALLPARGWLLSRVRRLRRRRRSP
jgi:hypothetical protein